MPTVRQRIISKRLPAGEAVIDGAASANDSTISDFILLRATFREAMTTGILAASFYSRNLVNWETQPDVIALMMQVLCETQRTVYAMCDELVACSKIAAKR